VTFSDRVLAALGDNFARRAGTLLPNLVRGLSTVADETDALIEPTERGWATAFDLDTTPQPRWLGAAATGTTVPGGLTLDQQRAYIRDRPQWRRGTPAAIREAVRAVLLPNTDRRVDLFERDGSPWRLRIRVWAATLPVGGVAAVKAAARTQMPVGLVLEVEALTGATFAHMAADHGPTFDDYAAAFATFDDATYHVPEG
jgi:hypothetical protein